MTEAANDRRIQATASAGQTVFTYDFKIVVAADIRIERRAVSDDTVTVLVEGSGNDYTLTGLGVDAGGTYVLTAGATLNDIYTAHGVTALARGTDYVDDLSAVTLNADFDELYRIVNRLQRDIDRSIRLPQSDSDGVVLGSDMVLGLVPDRAGANLGFDADGKLTTLLGTGGDLPVPTAADHLLFATGAGWVNSASPMPAEIKAALIAATARASRSALYVRRQIDFMEFGGLGDDGTDNKAFFDTALAAAIAEGFKTIAFPMVATGVAGISKYNFASQPGPTGAAPNRIDTGLRLIGDSDQTTWVQRDYTPAGQNDPFLEWTNSSGGGVSGLKINAPAGTANGYAIDITGDGTYRHSWSLFENMTVTGAGTWRRTFNVDGTLHTTSGSQGIRDVSILNCAFFGATDPGGALTFKNVVNLQMSNVLIAAGPSGVTQALHITGGGTALTNSSGANMTAIDLGGDLILDNCDRVSFTGTIAGALTIAATATNVVIVADVTGTITNNSASAIVVSPGELVVNGAGSLDLSPGGAFAVRMGMNSGGLGYLMGYSSGGEATVNLYANTGGNPATLVAKFRGVGSGLNYLDVLNGATGSGVTVAAVGGDSDIDLVLSPKGTKNVVLDGLSWPNADGANGQVLITDGAGGLSFTTVAGTGDVVGPGSSTDNALVRFDLATGKAIQNGLAILDDSGNLTGLVAVTLSGLLTAGGLAYPTADGSNGQVMVTNGSGTLSFTTVSGTGDVVGPGSATDNTVARFDTTTGKLIQGSGVVIDDTNNVSGVGNLALSGTVDGRDVAGDGAKLDGIASGANNYTHPNHSGDVTSVADGAQTIAASAVTLAKMANMATASLLGRDTAGAGAPEVLSAAAARTLLNVADGSTANPNAIDNVVEDTTPQLGGNLDVNGNDIVNVNEVRLDGLPDTDHTANGFTTDTFAAGEAITIMDLCYFDATAAEWLQADADVASSAEASGMLGISLAAGSNGVAMKVAVANSFVRDDTWTWTAGDILYVSATPGQITATRPATTGDTVRIVGYAMTADVIWFAPDNTYVVVG